MKTSIQFINHASVVVSDGETAVLRPWKYAKYMGLGFGLNAGGSFFAGGDEEAERALFSEGIEGYIFGLEV